ncbi:corticoliberin-like [Gouania willdenowi]|uniref:corticoliberin-like n=1 Tax=Gouania willdenowi TaxID=441366 RepID=UPI001055A8DE|nr:corticoliberin-like [Gouania willdenowi]XP_028328833.1 corticoliberin-like [Gouania willdenowi]
MKLNVLLWVATLLFAFLPHGLYGRPAEASAPGPQTLPLQKLFLQLASSASLSSTSAAVNRGWLQLTQQHLRAQEEEDGEKEKRSDDLPISLDLTFHLLREVLEMARAEQVSQQVENNRKMMDNFGK